MGFHLPLHRKKHHSQPGTAEQIEKTANVECFDCGAPKPPAEFGYRSRSSGQKNKGFIGRLGRKVGTTYRCVPPSEGLCPRPQPTVPEGPLHSTAPSPPARQIFDLSRYDNLDPADPVFRLLWNSNLGFRPRRIGGAESNVPFTSTEEVVYESNAARFVTRSDYWPYSRPYRDGDFEERFVRTSRPRPEISSMYI